MKYLPFILLTLTPFAQAATFRNSYVNFELPKNWSCKPVGTEWVCKSSNLEQARQAVIVVTAKEIGPNDNFAYYNQYLKNPKTPHQRDGIVTTQSKVQHLKTIQINNDPWIDGLHLGSLLPHFYSRYLVTIKNRIAVLVTFSAKKEYYSHYSNDFFKAINSMKVTADAIKDPIKTPLQPLETTAIRGESDSWPEPAVAQSPAQGSGKSSNLLLYFFAILLASVGAFLLLKRKKGGGDPRP